MTACLLSAESLQKITDSWESLTTSFGDPAHCESENVLQNQSVLSALQNLFAFDLDRAFIDWYFNNIQEYLKREIVEPFRDKSRNILSSHHRQLVSYQQFRSKSKSRKTSLSPTRSVNEESVHDIDNSTSSKVQFMNFDHFDVSIWGRFLKDVARIVEEVHCEITKIKTNISQIAHLLILLDSGRSDKGMVSFRSTTRYITPSAHDLRCELNQRCDLLIDTIFLMDGSDEFESIFRVLFEYAFIHFSKLTVRNDMRFRDELVAEFSVICTKLHRLRWLKVLEPVFINVGYGHIEYELHRNYRSRKSPHFVDYSLFEEPKLHEFKQWVHQTLLKWFHLITVHSIDISNQNDENNKLHINQSQIGNEEDDADDVDMTNQEDDVNESAFITPSKHKNKRITIDLFERNKNSKSNESAQRNRDILSVDELKTKIEYFLYEKFGEMRTMEMFDIICDFPDSEPALKDLKQCLRVTSQWRPLQIAMLSQFKSRILHHGASSTDIISQYIATIGALKILDPTGITLEIVGEPIRLFLRERDDAIRCVVSLLMEENNGRGACLLREFQLKMRSKPKFSNQNNIDMEWDEEEMEKEGGGGMNGDGNESEDSIASDLDDPTEWEPDPLDSMFAKSSIFKRNSDTIGLLVKIFGSREIFVEEYRKLLGDRLLSRNKRFFNVDLETEYLELMKLRFGEQSMQDCQVMVQDVINSQRVTTTIRDLRPNTKPFSATIISSQYWPQTNGDTNSQDAKRTLPFHLPESVEPLYDLYQETYAEVKKPREILWLADYGSVDLEIELRGQSVKIKTTPLNASVLMVMQQHFENEENKEKGDGEVIGRDLVCALVGMDLEDITPALTFWIRRGVIRKGLDSKGGVGYRLADGDEEEEHALQCLKKKSNQNMENQHGGAQNMDAAERLQIEEAFEKQVLSLLNFNALPIHQVHGLLRQIDVHPLFATISLNELQTVLDKLTNQKRLVFNDGMYKRAPK